MAEKDYKICKTCNEKKLLSDFPFVSTRNTYVAHCKICYRKRCLEYAHKTYHLTGEKKKQYAKAYYNKDVEKQKEIRRKSYLASDREKEKEKRRQWYIKNKERHAVARLEYEKNNKDRLRVARRKWENERLDTDMDYKLRKSLAKRIRNELKGISKKDDATEKLIGCSIVDFKKYIESKFRNGMTWQNWNLYGWHIDHKKPLSWFDLSKESERIKAFHYTNMQPLWAIDNLKKKNFYESV